MPVKLVVAVTDRDWFEHLRSKPHLTEVNFWSPGAASFRALEPGELFFFKLHAPHNYIAGFGIFAYANNLPSSLAWEAFGEANGAATLQEMRRRIARYRRAGPDDRSDFVIGCRVLAPVFCGCAFRRPPARLCKRTGFEVRHLRDQPRKSSRNR